jgi:hypothetical protein
MLFSYGPLTGILSACAGAAGTGILLGGLLAGVIGTVFVWEREHLDYQVRRSGYWGGVLGLGALILDQAFALD